MRVSIPGRISQAQSTVVTAATLLLSCGGFVSAQSPTKPSAPPSPQKFQGCVLPSPTEKTSMGEAILIFNTESACAKLTGKFAAAKISGHQIELNGVLTPAASAAPASIQVDSVVTVGKPCSDVCSLLPPHTRGLGKGGETPGKEGGTPGAVPSTPPPPQ
jgi:hypothetical protein